MIRKEPIESIKGVGSKTASLLKKLDIETIEDLLHYYPRDYQKAQPLIKLSDIQPEMNISVYASIDHTLSLQYIKRLQMVSGSISDETGSIQVRWFNMPYLRNSLKPGYPYVFCGKVVQKGNRLILEQPSVYPLEKYHEIAKSLQPVYALTKGITNAGISKLVKEVLKGVSLTQDPLPEDIRKQYQLSEYDFAMEQIHFPMDESHMLLARRRIVFEEFFLFILALRTYQEQHEKIQNHFKITKNTLIGKVTASLGYTLTNAQNKVLDEIQADLTGKKIMTRLIQGDVGSGKTIIAFLSMLLMAENGYQSALMVPTEVLARQHYHALQSLLEKHELTGYQPVLLTGSMTAKQKREAYARIQSGDASFVIGTHAVIQDSVIYHSLGLVITDEQHRFGVKQRESLENKGDTPHTMVMSATPIPRTLAVILYGDLDISVIDEMPASRIPIKNCVVNTSYRRKAYDFIEKEILKGHQAYIICPMVEESELIEAEDVISYTEKLKTELSEDIHISYLHGKMKAKEKNDVMEKFLRNEIQVLVSTTVIEVGVNVPNATVMMIENAERFGLAQLHQLRGRVGRGSDQSYCIMIAGTDGAEKKKRLEVLNKSNDGFYIANEDLKLRGPGDLLGVRQSGILEFELADIYTDAPVLKLAADAARRLLETDPHLESDQYRDFKKYLSEYMDKYLTKLNI